MAEYLQARENYSTRDDDQPHDCALWGCDRRGEHPYFQFGLRLPGPVDLATALEDAARAAVEPLARSWGIEGFHLDALVRRAD